jgi:hypothetical protein
MRIDGLGGIFLSMWLSVIMSVRNSSNLRKHELQTFPNIRQVIVFRIPARDWLVWASRKPRRLGTDLINILLLPY